jgi:hypothetical protein
MWPQWIINSREIAIPRVDRIDGGQRISEYAGSARLTANGEVSVSARSTGGPAHAKLPIGSVKKRV